MAELGSRLSILVEEDPFDGTYLRLVQVEEVIEGIANLTEASRKRIVAPHSDHPVGDMHQSIPLGSDDAPTEIARARVDADGNHGPHFATFPSIVERTSSTREEKTPNVPRQNDGQTAGSDGVPPKIVDLESAGCHRRPDMASHRFSVSDDDEGLRLDQVIAKNVAEISRTLAKKVIAEGGVFLERKRVKVAGRIVHSGQRVEVNIGSRSPSADEEDRLIDVSIVDLTKNYVVVNKPSGVFSAPTRESDRNHLLAFVGAQLKDGGQQTDLFLVHRLDRPTSGLMLIARTKAAAASLSAQLAEKSAGRHYLAILVGTLSKPTTVRHPIDGKDAVTDFTPIEQRSGGTLVHATLHTGRTHQVRVHAEHLGHPVFGDSKYGRRAQRGQASRPARMALHATELRFTDPESGKERVFSSPLPQELVDWFNSLPDLTPGC